MMSNLRNVIITGIPRSGTTLLAALIDSIPNAVALNEPDWQSRSLFNNNTVSGKDFAEWLVSDFLEIRQKLLAAIPIPERRGKKGEAVTNYYDRNGGEVRNKFDIVSFTKTGLTPDFMLAVKQVGPYLGILEQLVQQNYFQIIAIVRQPVAVISSWRSLTIPPNRGQLPGAVHWAEMQALTYSNLPLLEKQVKMYELMCQRLYKLRNDMIVLRHEDLLQSPLLLAQTMKLPESAIYDTSLISSEASYHANEDSTPIRQALERYGDYLFRFYPKLM